MLKKNIFHKKFSKLVLSITNRIESFFNLFKSSNFTKKNYLNLWKKTLEKKIFIGIATIFLAVIVYFLLPSFYNENKVRVQIESQILEKYNFKVILDENLQYGLFPKPYFFSKNVKIEYDTKTIAISKNSKFFISINDFFSFDKIKIQDLVFTETDFEIDHTNFKFFFKLLNNDLADKKVDFIKSKFFFLDQNEDVIFFSDIKKLNYLYQQENLNIIKSKFELFNLPIRLDMNHDIIKKNIYTKIDINSLKLVIENNLEYKDNDEFQGQIDFNLINKDQSLNYNLKKNDLNFNINNQLNGKINIKPFFLDTTLNLKEIEIKNFFKNDSIIINLLKSEILNNKNFNGELSVKANNLKDSKYINEVKFDVKFEEGIILLTNINFLFKNSVIFNLSNINLIVDNNKLKFIGDIFLNFKDIETFYSHFQIKKDYRKSIDQMSMSFVFNLDDNFIEFNELRANGVNDQILDKYLNNFNSEKKNILNKIIFRNTVKDFFRNISSD